MRPKDLPLTAAAAWLGGRWRRRDNPKMAVRFSRTFLLRKLHQLSGIIPLGVFLLEHFYTNSKALTGAADFNNAVKELQSIPYIIFVEIGGIFIPLLYHALYGLVITWEARPNNLHYPYPRNWFYTIQRLTGIVLFFFITFHVLNFRFGLIPGLNNLSVADNPFRAYDIVAGEFRNIVILIVYIIGITATVWHFANGLWLFMVDWGIVIGERAQRMLGYACIAFGVFLLAVGINAELAFVMQGGLLGLLGGATQ
jgi:succinate dehydrogenase / fumarate reductase cytochrome b subunit